MTTALAAAPRSLAGGRVRGIDVAVGIREIPRQCEPCHWQPDWGTSPVIWRLTSPHPGCAYHNQWRRRGTRP